jgi:hypothetical protein
VIDWELVEFVLCPQTEEEMTCSICLENPTCPRIAKCGHVFCWSCILQLFSYHEHTSLAPCPVCLREKIRLVDLRAVIVEKLLPVIVGSPLNLILVQRPKHLNLLYPSTMDPVLDSKKPLPYYEYEPCARFNRLLVTNQLLELFTTESLVLEGAIASAKSSQDLTLYMEVAQQMLKEEMATVESKLEQRASSSSSLLNSSGVLIPGPLSSSSGLLSPLSKPQSKHSLSELMPEKLEETNSFFFYQSADGQQIFLHPLIAPYMSEQFGHESVMPPILQNMKILDLETKTFDEKTRRKFPALAHLPISCQYHFALVDISELLTDPVRRASFHEDVKKRQDAIERISAREARRAEVHAQQAAIKQLQQQQALYNSRYASSTSSNNFGPDVVPPDLTDSSFPEINAIHLGGGGGGGSSTNHHYALSSPSTPSSSMRADGNGHGDSLAPPRPSSAWDKGTLMTSLNKAPEDAFPALPSHKDKNGNMVLTDESIRVHSPSSSSFASSSPSFSSFASSSPNSSATRSSSTAWGSSTASPTPNAWASGSSAKSVATSNPSNNSSSPAVAKGNNKKKQGKKTILVI